MEMEKQWKKTMRAEAQTQNGRPWIEVLLSPTKSSWRWREQASLRARVKGNKRLEARRAKEALKKLQRNRSTEQHDTHVVRHLGACALVLLAALCVATFPLLDARPARMRRAPSSGSLHQHRGDV